MALVGGEPMVERGNALSRNPNVCALAPALSMAWRMTTKPNNLMSIKPRVAQTLWLNRKPERVFDSGCKRGLSAEADLSTVLKTRCEAGSLITE